VTLTRLLATRQGADDAALLGRFGTGNDPAAFAELVRRHGPLVLGVCRRMLGHAHDADDAFQATFLALVHNVRAIRNPNALAGWLYGAAMRVCRKALARRGRSAPAAPASAGSDPSEDAAWKEVRGLLDEEMNRLPAAFRDPLVLCYFDGLSRDEAAGRLGLSRRTLMRRLDQARQRLRRRLERRGVQALGLGLALLLPERLAARVPEALRTAAVGVGTGSPVSATVRCLAGGASVRLLNLAWGMTLFALAGIGLGLAAGLPTAADAPPAAEAGEAAAAAPRRDADGRPLPPGAIHRLGSRRFRVEGRTGFALPSPDGKHILVQPQPSLSAYPAQGLFLLDADTGLRVRAFEDGGRVPKMQEWAAVRPAAFSPDGKTLYALAWHKSETTGNGISRVWASADLRCKRVLLIWDVATGKLRAERDLPAGNALGASLISLSVSPDAKRLYVFGAVRMSVNADRVIRGVAGLHVLDAATGRRLHTWDGAGHAAGVAAGGELITFRKGAAITAHDAKTGKSVRTFPLPGFVPSVVLSPDGRTLAAVGIDGKPGQTSCTVKLWEVATGREIHSLTAGGKTVGYSSARLVFSADGKTLYLGTGSGRVLRWDLASGRALPDWAAHAGMVKELFLRPGKNELVSAGAWDGAVRRWDAATGKAVSTGDAYVGEVAVARTPEGKAVAIGDVNGRVDVWDIRTGRVTRTLRLPADRQRRLAFSPDGRSLLDATDDGKVTVRDAATGKAGRVIPAVAERQEPEDGGWTAVAFSPDGRRLLLSRYGYGTRLLTWPECEVLWRRADSCYAAFSPDGGRLAAGKWHGILQLRDAKSGATLKDLPGEGMASAVFSPDGRRLVTAHLGGAWRVRDAATGEVLKEVKAFRYAWGVAFSPSGWLLAMAGDNSVRVYDTPSWQEVARFDGHDGTVKAVFFGADDRTLVSASPEDGTALVWSLKPAAGRARFDAAACWAGLAGAGPAVRQAVWAAAQHPDAAVELFRRKWPVPKAPLDPKQLGKLLAGLDAAEFAERESATTELAKMGRRAEPALRKELGRTTSAEAKRRIKLLLDRWAPPKTAELAAEDARELRAVWALELADTPAARRLVAEWAAAKVANRLGEEAVAALKRLRGRR
jgi:RNA polymerase sigma factor (sigma-70 family)